MYKLTRNECWFCGTLLMQALFVAILEVYILVQWQSWVKPNVTQVPTSYVVPIGIGIMPFACIYEAILSLDAIYHKNNICLLAICASNICVAVYAVLQYTKIEGAIDSVRASTDGMGDHLVDISRDIWIYIRPAELAVPVMLGIGTLVLVPASCRLHKDYAWAIYKCIQGNTELRLRYIAYKVYLVLIKFDFFFLVAFIVQYDLIDVHFKEPEYSLTMAFIPASLLVMVFGIYCVKAELKIAMGFIILCFLGLITYLLSRIILLARDSLHANVSNGMMLLFASVSLVLTVLTLGCAVQCVLNFDYGLKKITHGVRQWPQSSHVFHRVSTSPSPAVDTRYNRRLSLD